MSKSNLPKGVKASIDIALKDLTQRTIERLVKEEIKKRATSIRAAIVAALDDPAFKKTLGVVVLRELEGIIINDGLYSLFTNKDERKYEKFVSARVLKAMTKVK